jgi:hypothetical protein
MKYAVLYLTGDLSVEHFENVGDVFNVINRCTKHQLPYMTFELKPRKGHVGPVWHPRETRFFDPAKR